MNYYSTYEFTSHTRCVNKSSLISQANMAGFSPLRRRIFLTTFGVATCCKNTNKIGKFTCMHNLKSHLVDTHTGKVAVLSIPYCFLYLCF